MADISAADLLGDYPAIRYYPPTGDLYFDIITRLGDAVTFETVARELKDVSGVIISVATPAALYRMKKDTVRAKDRQDATALRAISAEGRPMTSGRVEKFRSIADMNAADVIVRRNGDFDQFLRHCARCWELAPRIYPRGVFRFRSIEEAEAARCKHRAG